MPLSDATLARFGAGRPLAGALLAAITAAFAIASAGTTTRDDIT